MSIHTNTPAFMPSPTSFWAAEQPGCFAERHLDPSQKLIQLLVVMDCKRKMSRAYSCFLAITRRIPSELKHFSSEIIQRGSQVNRSPPSDTFTIVPLMEKPTDSTNRKLKPSTERTALDFPTSSLCPLYHDPALQPPRTLQTEVKNTHNAS
uniref:Uncharacterized protein n=1 Tax=Ascaris lumbricoides TaxID=6252 RepID=A0A0M3HXZ0_ASCLU